MQILLTFDAMSPRSRALSRRLRFTRCGEFGLFTLIGTSVVIVASAGRLRADDKPASGPRPDAAAAAAVNPIWLSDLSEQDVHVGRGQFGKAGHAGFANVPISVNGVGAGHGLGMHPPLATATYRLERKYKTFRSTAAINDSSLNGPQAPVFFQIEADGKPIWQSHALFGPRAWQPVYLDVSGVDRMVLKVDFHTSLKVDNEGAHAVWLEPFVSKAAPNADLLKAQAAEHYAKIDEAADYMARIRNLLEQEKFADLEQLGKEAREKRDFLDGNQRLRLFYSALYPPLAETEAARLEQIDRAGDWQKAFPESVIPRLVAADNWISFGYAARGTGFANTVTEEGWKAFNARMAKAENVLRAAGSFESRDAEYYTRLIGLAQSQSVSRELVDPLFEKALNLDSTYYPACLAMAHYLLPRWHGEPGDEVKLAEYLFKRIDGPAGKIAYAMIAMQHAHYDGMQLLTAAYPYEHLMAGFEAIADEFPTQFDKIERGAWLAAVSDDRTAALKLLDRFPPQCCDPRIWGTPQVMWACRHWAASDPPPELARTLHAAGVNPFRMTISADGGTLVTGGYDGAISLWDVEKGTPSDAAFVSGQINVMEFDPKSPRFVVSVGNSRSKTSLLLYRIAEGGPQATPLEGHRRMVYDIAFSRDGKRLASASADKTARIWPLDDLKHSLSIPHANEVCSVGFSPDGARLCTTTNHGAIAIWDAETGKPIDTPLTPDEANVVGASVRYLPDGDHLLEARLTGMVRLWDLKTRTAKGATTGPSEIWCDDISPDGRWFAVGRENGSVELFDSKTLEKVHTFADHWGRVTGLTFTPDGQSLVSASADLTLKIWKLSQWTAQPAAEESKR